MAETLSEYRLREDARMRGREVTHKQFDGYINAGLLPPPDARGRWPLNVVDMLVAIRDLGEIERPLPRRVIHLFRSPLFKHIGTERLRPAMMTIPPSTVDPDAKFDFSHTGALALERAEAKDGDPRAAALLPIFDGWTSPPVSAWAGILSVYDALGFAWVLPRAYDQAAALAALPGAPPFAELVTMLTVRLVVAYTLFAIKRERQNGVLAEANAM